MAVPDAVPVRVTVIFCPVQVLVVLSVKAGLKELDTTIEWAVVSAHPLSLTIRLTVCVPDVGQLMLYGPPVVPLTTLAPLKFQLYVAVPEAGADSVTVMF